MYEGSVHVSKEPAKARHMAQLTCEGGLVTTIPLLPSPIASVITRTYGQTQEGGFFC